MTVEQYKSEIFNRGQSDRPVVAVFYATWCSPCQRYRPILDSVAADLSDFVDFIYIDIDKNAELGEYNKVISVPTLLFYDDGELLNRKVGYMAECEIKKLVCDTFNLNIGESGEKGN